MANALTISDTEYAELQHAASVSCPSLSGQAEHWMRIGRAVERDPSVAYSRIDQALRGLLPAGELDNDEQDEYLERHTRSMSDVSKAEGEFWTKRQREGLGVGMNDEGELVFAAKR